MHRNEICEICRIFNQLPSHVSFFGNSNYFHLLLPDFCRNFVLLIN